MSLAASGLVLAHGPRTVMDGVSLSLEPGEFVAVVGPNGSGKSTILRSLARLHPLKAGSVTLNGADIARLGSKEIARDLAILPQSPDAGLDLTVRELAWRGRYPHQGVLQRATAPDYEAVADALAAADVEDIADRRPRPHPGGNGRPTGRLTREGVQRLEDQHHRRRRPQQHNHQLPAVHPSIVTCPAVRFS